MTIACSTDARKLAAFCFEDRTKVMLQALFCAADWPARWRTETAVAKPPGRRDVFILAEV